VGVNINVGAQPDWGPYGYDYVQYYYFPDIDIYYDVLNREFVYFDGYDWEFSPYLPQAYSDFDLYGAYKVVINEPRPYLRADYYRRTYYNYRGYHNQPVIRDYRNNRFNDRREDERFEQRPERFEQREPRFENQGRMDRDNHGSFDQRNHGNNRDGFDQRGNGNYRGERMNGNERGGFSQRNDNRNFGRR
jgi:hypothetical protein